MIYKAEDKWNTENSYMEHAMTPGSSGGRHKYIMKIGTGPNARYFYTPEEVAAYRNSVRGGAKNSGDVRNLRNTNQRAQLNTNRATDRLQRTQIRKEQQAANARNERTLAGKRREDRKQAYVDFQRNRGKSPAPAQKKPMNDNRRLTNNANSVKRSATQISNMKKANAAKQRAYEKAHPIETGIKKARKAANSAYKSANKAANSAYKSAKKAYNSKQGKAVRKKVKRTAQSAYKRGSSFVKKLLGR